MKLFRFLISKVFVTHILLAVLLLFALLLLMFNWLNSHTRHGESMAVPELRGIRIEQAADVLKQKNLRYVIIDSVFFPDKPKNTVVDQNPLPEEKVKEGRVIYLTLNSSEPPKVKMPNLIDVSYRQAQTILLSYGLKEGQITYKPDLAQNVVLEQLWNGHLVLPETQIPKGSVIDLVLGDGLGKGDMMIPNLNGLTYEEALFVLQADGLAMGTATYDEGADKTTARVYQQSPAFSPDAKITPGQSIDISLR